MYKLALFFKSWLIRSIMYRLRNMSLFFILALSPWLQWIHFRKVPQKVPIWCFLCLQILFRIDFFVKTSHIFGFLSVHVSTCQCTWFSHEYYKANYCCPVKLNKHTISTRHSINRRCEWRLKKTSLSIQIGSSVPLEISPFLPIFSFRHYLDFL